MFISDEDWLKSLIFGIQPITDDLLSGYYIPLGLGWARYIETVINNNNLSENEKKRLYNRLNLVKEYAQRRWPSVNFDFARSKKKKSRSKKSKKTKKSKKKSIRKRRY